MWLVTLLLLSIVFIVVATTKLKMHPFLALLLTAFGFGILSGMPLLKVVESVNAGFGGAFGKVLQNSGIADVIGNTLAGTNLGIWLPLYHRRRHQDGTGFLDCRHHNNRRSAGSLVGFTWPRR